jgi:hypothetical protein
MVSEKLSVVVNEIEGDEGEVSSGERLTLSVAMFVLVSAVLLM